MLGLLGCGVRVVFGSFGGFVCCECCMYGVIADVWFGVSCLYVVFVLILWFVAFWFGFGWVGVVDVLCVWFYRLGLFFGWDLVWVVVCFGLGLFRVW